MIGEFRDYSNKSLFEFDTLIDLQIGVVKALQEDLLPGGPPSSVNVDFLQNSTEKSLKIKHMTATDEMLISNCFNNEINAMEIFNDYIRDQFKRILDLSPKTQMTRLVSMFCTSDIIGTSIICHNDIEKNFVNETFKNVKNKPEIITLPEKEIIVSNFARIFISDIYDVFRFYNLAFRHICVLNYSQNFKLIDGKRIITPEIMISHGDINEIEIADPFNEEELK